MSSIKLLKLAASMLAVTAASSAVAGSIVIRASGPSAKLYPTGKSIADGQKVVLKSGDTVVLLDAKGTRTLSGAGSYDVGSSVRGVATASAFTALIGNAGTRQVRTGAVRGTGAAQPRVASLWYVDTSKSGTVCLKDTGRATLWRADMMTPVVLTLWQGGKSVPLAFSAGQAVKSWPVADLPLSAGSDYRISGPGLATPTTIRIASFASASDSPEDVASALIAKGCTAQLDALVEAGKASSATG